MQRTIEEFQESMRSDFGLFEEVVSEICKSQEKSWTNTNNAVAELWVFGFSLISILAYTETYGEFPNPNDNDFEEAEKLQQESDDN